MTKAKTTKAKKTKARKGRPPREGGARVQMFFRTEPATVEEIAKMAKRAKCPESDMMRRIVDRGIADLKRQAKQRAKKTRAVEVAS